MQLLGEAEGEGIGPSSDETARNGFRDRRIRPLCHPSAGAVNGSNQISRDEFPVAAGAGLGPAGGEATAEKAQPRRRGHRGEHGFPRVPPSSSFCSCDSRLASRRGKPGSGGHRNRIAANLMPSRMAPVEGWQSGRMRRSRKPFRAVSSDEGSNPSPSASSQTAWL
jgi:hypothetical protein